MASSDTGRIIGVVGFKDSGKTQIVEGLVGFLGSKGFAVGTVKHVYDDLALQPAAKDSVRHLDAGARITVVVGKDLVEVLNRDGDDLDGVLARYLCLCDYIVVEGFKRAGIPKIAVVSEDEDILEEADNIVAVVGRGDKPHGYPAFAPDEIDKLGDFLIEKKVLREPAQRVSLLVNGKPVPMNEFVQSSLSGVIKGFIDSLRGVQEASTIELTIK
jgi:molybdopterin-guanine dinucleotide biosynthesis protein B